MHQHRLFRLFGMQVWVTPPTLLGFLLIWTGVGIAAWYYLGATPIEMIVGGFLAAVLHQIVGLVHHLGHFVAARQTGYPMEGVVFGRWLFFGTSVYPSDEPALSGDIHSRRAWGGPIASALFGILASIVAAMLRESGGMAYWLAVFTMFDSLFLFFIGPLIPLRVTDGATILYYRAVKKAGKQRDMFGR
ncbi:MAG: hypothetical protein M9928_00175 [Anaerolineae bacterium]|nr:hypothetical protein [Anaerolineae bacterium]MCO5192452.1 hypothetical protein [Anaerolineae bacterium]MCO5203426.1 hypothetical protein [Anaerolineae bacterium]